MAGIAFADLVEITAESAERMRPPKEISVTETVCESMRVPLPSGGVGRYSVEQTPYMSEPMDMIASRLFESVVFVGPAQSGKTIALIEGSVVYSVVESPADCLIIQTNQRQAEDFSKFRIDRLIARSPALAERLSQRPQDDNVFSKSFRNSMALRLGWPSIAHVSGKPIQRVLLTDVDNFTGDMAIDELFGAALKRIQTFYSAGKIVAESSPARDFDDPNWQRRTPHEAPPAVGICSLFNAGDRRRWYWPCPECKESFEAAPGIGGFALPQFDELKEMLIGRDVLPIAEKFARLTCPNCGVAIEHRWKRSMNAAGRWLSEGQKLHADGTVTGEPIRSKCASFWLGGVAAGFQTWLSLVERHLAAVKSLATTGDASALKTTMNVDQAVPFVPVTIRADRDSNELSERAEDLEQGVVPEGARYIVATIDVQSSKFVVQVQAWGPALQWYPVDRFALKSSRRQTGKVDENGDPLWHPLDPASYPEDWRRIVDMVMERRYPLADGSGRTMGVRVTLCDSGGKAGVTRQAYAFYRYLRTVGLQSRFYLVKGSSAANAPSVRITRPDARDRNDRQSGAAGDVPVLMLNVNQLKDQVIGFAFRATPGPGYMHFAKWLKDSFYDELTAEVRTAEGWRNVHGRMNETMDLTVYALAAVIALGADLATFWEKPRSWALPWDENSEVRSSDGKAIAPIPPNRPARARVLKRSNYMANR